jgi:apolipoprotein N-acyltransferase
LKKSPLQPIRGIHLLNVIIAFSISILSGVLLGASFPPFDLHFVAWIALVPLFLVIARSSPKYSFVWSLLAGIIFFTGAFSWITEIARFAFPHHAVLLIYFGTYFGFFGLAFSFISRRWGVTPALVAAPFVWVSLEYIRSNLAFVAFPGGLLAHTQYQNTSLIQIASVTGAYGISFLVVMVNSAVAALLLYSTHGSEKTETSLGYLKVSKRGMVAITFTVSALTALTVLYGYLVVTKSITGKPMKVAVVQGNIEQHKKWDRKYANFIMGTYAHLTQEVAKDQPALIIWPETATPRAISRDLRLQRQVRRIAQEAGTYLLLGSAQHQKFKGKAHKKTKYFNSAFLIPPEPRTKNQRYDKILLMPFGEYLPLEEVVPWSYINVPHVGSYMPGKDSTIFKLPTSSFGVTICWESIFPDLVRQFVKNGAQFIVNMTNEAWFGKTAAPYQFVTMNVFRAVENRVYVVRCANTGISCFIDPYGRIVDRVKDSKGQDIFVRGVLTGSVIPQDSKTIYTRCGDLLAWLSLLCSAVFLLIAFLKKNPEQESMARTN